MPLRTPAVGASTPDPNQPPLVADVSAGNTWTEQPTCFDQRTWLVLLAVWVITLGYAWSFLLYGWISRDDGLLAHSAERVLNGELPHRDFQDVYVGLLSYLHALVFRISGTNLASLRYALLFAFALFVPAFFWIAARIANRSSAAAATLIAAAWSIGNYPASMPSWYNLFFATFGLAAVFRYLEAPSGWLLFAAGVSAGISCLFKITGLYFVAALLLFFLWRSGPGRTAGGRDSQQHRWFVASAVTIFLATVVWVLRTHFGGAEIYHFLIPQLALAAVVLRRTRTAGTQPQWRLTRTLPIFLAGVLAPMIVFAAWYASQGVLRILLRGTFVLPARRLLLATRSPAPLVSVLPMLVVLGLVVAAATLLHSRRHVIDVALAFGFLVVLVFSGNSWRAFSFGWYVFATSIPPIVMLAAFVLRGSDATPENERLMLVASTVTVCSLIQYPFSFVVYFCYVAPLVVLLALALVKRYSVPHSTLYIVSLFALFFPVLGVRPLMERAGHSYVHLAPLDIPRAGGLHIPSSEVREYKELVQLVHEHAPAGAYIYATPDEPQVYFLTETRNPTPILYEIFDEPRGQTARILQALAAHDVKAVVIGSDVDPLLHIQFQPDLLRQIQAEFPKSAKAGRFEVRWRP